MKKKLYSKLLILSALGSLGIAGAASVATHTVKREIVTVKAEDAPTVSFTAIGPYSWNAKELPEVGGLITLLKTSSAINGGATVAGNIAADNTQEIGTKMTFNGTPVKDVSGFGIQFKTLGADLSFSVPKSLLVPTSEYIVPEVHIPSGTHFFDVVLPELTLYYCHNVWCVTGYGAPNTSFVKFADQTLWNNKISDGFSENIIQFSTTLGAKSSYANYAIKNDQSGSPLKSLGLGMTIDGVSFAEASVSGMSVDYGQGSGYLHFKYPISMQHEGSILHIPEGVQFADSYLPECYFVLFNDKWTYFETLKTGTPTVTGGTINQYNNYVNSGSLKRVLFEYTAGEEIQQNGLYKKDLIWTSIGEGILINGKTIKQIALENPNAGVQVCCEYGFGNIRGFYMDFPASVIDSIKTNTIEILDGAELLGHYLEGAAFAMNPGWGHQSFLPGSRVGFDANGGSVNKTQYIEFTANNRKYSDAISGVVATKPGYVFDKWLLNGEPVDLNATIGKYVTLTASYVDAVTVKFDGTTLEDAVIGKGSKVTQPANPTKDGYDFLGWFDDAGFVTPFDFNTPINADKTIYAKFVAHTYNKVDKVDETVDTDGCKEHYTCDNCDKIFVKDGENYVEANASDLVIPKTLPAYKTNAINSLATYVNKANYRKAQQEEIDSIIEEATTAIELVSNKAAVDAAVNDAHDDIDKVKTDAELTAAELVVAKTNAKNALDTYVSASDYRTAEQVTLTNAIAAGKEAIDAAEDIAAVNTAVTNAHAAIDAIKTDAQMTDDENKAEAKDIDDLIDAIVATEYGQTLTDQYNAAYNAYDAASDDVKAYVTVSKVNKMNAINNAIYQINNSLYTKYTSYVAEMGSQARATELYNVFLAEAKKIIAAAYTAGIPDTENVHPIYDAFVAGANALKAVPNYLEDYIDMIPSTFTLETTVTVATQSGTQDVKIANFVASIASMYNAASDLAKSCVDNLAKLQNAVNAVNALNKIAAIGEVVLTDDSKALIDTARAGYDALTADEKAMITDADLVAAETAYAGLVADFAQYKADKTAEMQAAYDALDMGKYTEESKAILEKALADTKAAIEAAKDKASVDKALEDGKAALSAVEQIVEATKGCGGSVAATAGIISLVTLLGACSVVGKKRKQD